jgi:hypothetical protein
MREVHSAQGEKADRPHAHISPIEAPDRSSAAFTACLSSSVRPVLEG